MGANTAIGDEDGKTETQDQGQRWHHGYLSSYVLDVRTENWESV